MTESEMQNFDRNFDSMSEDSFGGGTSHSKPEYGETSHRDTIFTRGGQLLDVVPRNQMPARDDRHNYEGMSKIQLSAAARPWSPEEESNGLMTKNPDFCLEGGVKTKSKRVKHLWTGLSLTL